MLVLVIGDFHIPNRAADLPEAFKKLLVPGKIQVVLCTGNLCTNETHRFLKSLAHEVHVVQGDADEDSQWPEYKVVTVGQFKIGLCHGHQIVPWGDSEALAMAQRQLGVDIMITGHTHVMEQHTQEGVLYLNPGSATGALSPTARQGEATFMLLDIQDGNTSCYMYQLDEAGQVKHSRLDHKLGQ